MFAILNSFLNVFSQFELRKKLLFTLTVLAVYRLGVHIPLPGLDPDLLAGLFSGSSMGGKLLGFFDLLSGGALRRGSIFALGISPYITASIMTQILTMAIPSWEAKSKEGEQGRKEINSYTRLIALGVSIMQGTVITAAYQGYVTNPGLWWHVLGVLVLSTSAIFIMWLGEQITQRGIGQGSSMIIFASIVSGLPSGVYKLWESFSFDQVEIYSIAGVIAFLFLLVAVIVFIERGERRVNIQYAKRVIGQKVYGGISRHIPFKLNPVGVMPIILASTVINVVIMALKGMVLGLQWFNVEFFTMTADFVNDSLLHSEYFQMGLLVLLIIFFEFFYTMALFNPADLAENLKKSGGFIAGIRPGRKTAEFIDGLLLRLGFPGAMYLALLTIFPRIALQAMSSPVLFDGTSLLIAVGVALEVSNQLDAALIDKKYEGFTSRHSVRK